jgi:hypothetical protein
MNPTCTSRRIATARRAFPRSYANVVVAVEELDFRAEDLGGPFRFDAAHYAAFCCVTPGSV